MLIGRLARDVNFSGVGKLLVLDALARSFQHSGEVAAAVVLVDAKSEQAREFYERYGFIRPYRRGCQSDCRDDRGAMPHDSYLGPRHLSSRQGPIKGYSSSIIVREALKWLDEREGFFCNARGYAMRSQLDVLIKSIQESAPSWDEQGNP
jgi:hypothetical protein